MSKRRTYHVIKVGTVYVRRWDETNTYVMTTSCIDNAMKHDSQRAAELVAEKVYALLECHHDVRVFRIQLEGVRYMKRRR